MAPGAVHVVDDQQGVFGIQVFVEVLQPVGAYLPLAGDLREVIVAAAVRGPDRDMIRIHAEVLQAFLHVNADGRTAAPEADDKVGPEAAVVYLGGQPVGVLEQLLLADEGFFHMASAGITRPSVK